MNEEVELDLRIGTMHYTAANDVTRQNPAMDCLPTPKFHEHSTIGELIRAVTHINWSLPPCAAVCIPTDGRWPLVCSNPCWLPRFSHRSVPTVPTCKQRYVRSVRRLLHCSLNAEISYSMEYDMHTRADLACPPSQCRHVLRACADLQLPTTLAVTSHTLAGLPGMHPLDVFASA